VVGVAQAEQPTLAGLELWAPREQPARFAVWGLLDEDAHVYVQAGRVHLLVVVAQHLQRHPEAQHVVADYVYPDDGRPLAAIELDAEGRARLMRCRTEVVVSGQVLVPSIWRGSPCSRLVDVLSIRLADEAIAAHTHHHPVEG
jgi:hypothetical protein